MTPRETIADILLTKLAELEESGPELPVAFPDVAFDPPANGKYLRAGLYFNSNYWESLGGDGVPQGLLTVTVVWPTGQGIMASLNVADKIKQAFQKGLSLTSGSVKVTINKAPWSGSPIEDEGQTLVPVTISWMASG